MRRLLKSQNYLMNYLGFVLLLGFISLGAIGGCSDNNDGGQGSTGARTALTENDFWKDPGLVADPDEHIIVKFLEHPESEGHENDTGEVGHDIIPHTYTRTLEHTFCWEDEDDGSVHFMELDDLDGNEILRVEANGECVTAVIEAGDYVMTIWHDERVFKNHAIFIRHGHNEDLGTRRGGTIPEGTLDRAGSVLSKILAKLDNIIAQETNAQTVADNIETLITTNSCIGCDLSGADLSGQELIGTDLTGADLTGVDFTRVTLMNTIFSSATWCDGSCMCGDNSIDKCLGCASINTCTASDEVQITLVNNCDQTIWAVTENIPGNLRWKMNEKGCTSDQDCGDAGGTCNIDTRNCEQIVQIPNDCDSCKIWPATGCNFETGQEYICPKTSPMTGEPIVTNCCATGGIPTPEKPAPISPVTVAEFTLQGDKPDENDFYDVSIIDGYNVGIEMFPIAEKTTFLPPPNSELIDYWCLNAGGPIYGSTNPTPNCGMQGQPPCSNLNPDADSLWENYFGEDCGGYPGLRTVDPMYVSNKGEDLCPEGSEAREIWPGVAKGYVCNCTDNSQCNSDQICGIGHPQTVNFKVCGRRDGCENPKSLCVSQYFQCASGECKEKGESCEYDKPFECTSSICAKKGTDPKKFPVRCGQEDEGCECSESPAGFLNCRDKFTQVVECENTSDCPVLGGLVLIPGVINSCPDGTESVRINKEGLMGCQMKCESNQCRSFSCTKDSDCVILNDNVAAQTGIGMLCDTTLNQCVATISSMLRGTGVNGQSCTNPSNFEGCMTTADCKIGECNPETNFCELDGIKQGRYNAATTLCSGCTDELESTWPLPPSKPCAKKGGEDPTTGNCDDIRCTNPDWVDNIVPLITPFKKACPTCYVFPFDDTTATFQCRKPPAGNLQYQITFCPSR